MCAPVPGALPKWEGGTLGKKSGHGPFRTIVWPLTRDCLVFITLHSLLASDGVKGWVERIVGVRYVRGLYRVFYNLQSGASLGWLAWRMLRLPDRAMYKVPAPLSWVMRLGQGLFALLGVSAALAIGIPEFAGLTSLQRQLTGRTAGNETEAQGPSRLRDGSLHVAGPFRFTRHPANWSFMGIFLLMPVMTVKRATLAVSAIFYLVAGSLHEERRLEKKYGAAYRQYRTRVPFMIARSSTRLK